MEVALPYSKQKTQQHNMAKLLLTHITDEPGMHTAVLARVRREKGEEMGAADGVIHKKYCFFNIQPCVI